ncbi:MAG: 1-acyl-sn-glycerol-3-phosphate acyltransferase [Lachnospiraceae bacterium]|nr:1-acyl-sn-glycerol-3-phosphate acyltransferase [Lachnospiraceae bacterium]
MLLILTLLGIISAAVSYIVCRWYALPLPWNILVAIGLLLAGIILWEVIYWVVLYLWSLCINKKKEVTKPSKFYKWIFTESTRIGLFFLNVHVHVEGAEKLPAPGTRFLVVANHLSNYDPMSVIYALRKHMLVFVSKPENFNIPLTGAMMHKSGFMAIDRDHVKNALVTINKAAGYIKDDLTSVFIFPEGTRNRTQKPLLEFKNGAFKIATKANCPVVIIAISGTEFVKKRIPRRSDVYLKIVDVVSAEKVKELNTAGLSEHAFKLIYENITHGKDENGNPIDPEAIVPGVKKEEKKEEKTEE